VTCLTITPPHAPAHTRVWGGTCKLVTTRHHVTHGGSMTSPASIAADALERHGRELIAMAAL
jgi:hypothetical protein